MPPSSDGCQVGSGGIRWLPGGFRNERSYLENTNDFKELDLFLTPRWDQVASFFPS